MIQHGIIAIAAAASVSTSIVSAQTHQTDDPKDTGAAVSTVSNREFPQPLLQPQLLLHPHPVLHPESQPHPQSHPQLVAAKSLIDKSSSKFYLHFIIWQESVHSYKKVDSVYSLRYNKRNVTFL